MKKRNTHTLEVVTPDEVKQSYARQKDGGGWTFHQERAFVENLLQTRFNFLIATYSLVILAFVQAKDRGLQLIILFFGLVIITQMSLSIYRVYLKFDIIMKMLHCLDNYHVLQIQSKEMDERIKKMHPVKKAISKPANPLIGWKIPMTLAISIISMFIFVLIKCCFHTDC